MEKHDQALADKLYAKPQSSDPSDWSGKPSESDAMKRRRMVMAALWKRMREYFGQSWVREYGEVTGEAISTWMDALGIFTEEQIASGVKACQNWTNDFPPTLAQFKQLCLTEINKPNYTERRIEQEKTAGKSITMLEHLARHAVSPVATAEIEKMIRISKGEEVETKEASYENLGLIRRWGGL